MTQDALFDLEALTREAVAATQWTGRCPLGYSTAYYTPDELDAATNRWRAQYGDFGCIPHSHMWFKGLSSTPLLLDAHQLHVYFADGRCDLHLYGVTSPASDPALHDHSSNPLPGTTMVQVNCPPCRWHRIDSNETTLIYAWHDHAMPGWRNLPRTPHKLVRAAAMGERRALARVADWVTSNYPTDWQFSGAPIITSRSPNGRRCVPGRSPLGGYDLSDPTEEDDDQ